MQRRMVIEKARICCSLHLCPLVACMKARFACPVAGSAKPCSHSPAWRVDQTLGSLFGRGSAPCVKRFLLSHDNQEPIAAAAQAAPNTE